MSECLKFLFWNAHRNPSNIELITQYGQRHCIDIIALCEATVVPGQDLHGFSLVEHIIPNDDIVVMSNPNYSIFYTRERERYCLLRIENGYDLNFAVVHLNSKLYSDGDSRRKADINQLITDLKIEEAKYDNQNSMVFGDFNEEPYAINMTDTLAFNSVFFKCSIGSGKKKIHDFSYDVFYNPMLHILRDDRRGEIAKGTYYYSSANKWSFYDQVLMKKPLIDLFNQDHLRIISDLDGIPLVSGHKTNTEYSDHVPITFEISKRR